MIKIYHNPRCSKSRQGLEILNTSGKDFEIINSLKNPITVKELTNIVNLLHIEPIDLIRKNEIIWKSEYKNKELTNDEIIIAMIKNPKLIERPIVINNEKAVIGRPPEKIKEILD